MQKSTKKFLSVLLSIAMLLSFPIAVNANQAYEETFKGTYTAPSQAKNTLISGDDARLTEWYGDRVNAGSKTYSVRQNQYGLNKDGNMIDAEEGVKYTVWLAQYGVASFRFEAPEAGDYIVLTSRNEKYTDKDDLSLWRNWVHILNSRMNLRSEQYEGSTLDNLQYNARYSYCVYQKQYKGGVFYVTAGARTDRDCVYDVQILNVNKLNQDTCPHYISDEIGREKKGCTTIYTNKCKICGKEYNEKETHHKWNEEEQVELEDGAENYCENEVFYKEKCSECGKLESYFYPRHDITKKTVKLVNKESLYNEICCTYHCELCDDYFEKYIESPCYNSEIDETEHDFGDVDWDEVDCIHPAICKKCGYKDEGSHDYGDVDLNKVDCKHQAICNICGYKYGDHNMKPIREYLNPSHSCYVERGEKCEVCGKQELDDMPYVYHSAWTFVQVTPQTDKKCGTYRMYCEDCGEYITKTATLHTGEWVFDEKEGKYFMTCTRCGDRVSYDEMYPDKVIPGGSTGGSTGGGGGGYVPAPAPEDTDKKDDDKKPETKPSETTPAPSTSKKPATVTASKPQAKQEAVVVTWKPAKDVDGYEVQVATDKKFKKNKKSVKVNKKKAKKKTVKNLKKNKKYYVRVRSYKIVNGKKVYGKWSKVKAVKTK